MLHVLVPEVENNPELRESLLGLRGGPYLSTLPSNVQKWLERSLLGKVYTGLVEANRAKFESGVFAPEDMGRVIPKLALDFRVTSHAGHLPSRRQIERKVQRLLDQLVDDLSYRKQPFTRPRTLSLRDLSNLVKTYWLHNALIASFTGLWHVKEQGNDLAFHPQTLFLTGLTQGSHATWSDDQALDGFRANLKNLLNKRSSSIDEKPIYRVSPKLLLGVACEILDRFYVIHLRFLDTDNHDVSSTPLTENALEILKWLALVALDPESSLTISETNLAHLELRQDVLNEMIDHTKANPSPLDQGISLANGKLSSRGIDMRHLTRLYVDLVIKNPAKKNRAVRSQGPGISDGIGMWFEQSYIRRFIKESDLSNDYLVAEGFKSRSQEEPYDVDLIIVDKVRSQIFLAQVKYHRRFRYYRWGDEIYDLFQYDDSGILKGYRQLKSVRQSITNTRVLDQIVNCLRKSGSKYPRNKIVPQNVHYVLLHTVTSLDFALINGICLYEWNTFRHLLRRGLSHKLVFRSGQITQVEAIQEDRVLPVEDPEVAFQLTTKRFLDDESGAKMVPHDDSAAYKMSVEVPQLIENGKFRGRLKINIITPSF